MPKGLSVALDPAQLQEPIIWEGWGTSLAWFAVALGGHEQLRQHISTLLFSREPAAGLGMNIVRYNIGGACQEHAHEYRPGAAVPCFRQPDGSYHWDADSSQTAMLLAAAQQGADTFEAFVNSPPWFWTESGNSRGHDLPLVNNLKQQHINEFAAFCTDVVQHFRTEHGIHFSTLSPFNEPSSPAWCLKMDNKQEGCYFSRSRAHTVLRALAQQPAIQSNNIQLVAYEQFCLRDTLSDLNCTPKDLWGEFKRINLHTYTSKHFLPSIVRPYTLWQDNILWRKQVRNLAHAHDQKLWISEFGSGRGAFAVAKQVIRDIAQLKPSAWVYWQAVEALGVGWGLLEVPLEGHAATADSGTPSMTSVGSTDGSGALQQTGQDILLHPNYFVMQFIMQCIPVGAAVYSVKPLGKCGVLVQQSRQHWVLLYINTHKNKQQLLTVDVSPLLGSAGTLGADSQSATVTASTVKHNSSVHRGVVQLIAASGAAPAVQPTPPLSQLNSTVQLLDVLQLRSVVWHPGMAVTPWSAVERVCQEQLEMPMVVGADGWMRVEVPSQHLCRVHVLLA